jgi:hypothetical protein
LARNIAAVAVVAALLAAATAGAQAVIDGGDVRNNSLTGKDVKNKSLTKKDFRGSVRGPRGRRGLPGPQGAAGPQGPPGPTVLGRIVRVEGPTVIIPAGDLGSAEAVCPAGHGVVSGGFSAAAADAETFFEDDFGSRNAWVVGLDNFDSLVSAELSAIAYCAPAGQAVTAARVNRWRSRVKAAVEQQRQIRVHATTATLHRAKPCSAGYTHAVMPDGAHKCLRAGQFCSHKRGWQRAYHRYGYHCKRNGRLRNY